MMVEEIRNKPPLLSVDDLLDDLEIVDTLQERVAFLEAELRKARGENNTPDLKKDSDNVNKDHGDNNDNNNDAERFQPEHRLSVTSALTDPSFDPDDLASDMEDFSNQGSGMNNSGSDDIAQDEEAAARYLPPQMQQQQQRTMLKKRPSIIRSSSYRSGGNSSGPQPQTRRRVSFSCHDNVPADAPEAIAAAAAAAADIADEEPRDLSLPAINNQNMRRNRRATIGIESLDKCARNRSLSIEEENPDDGGMSYVSNSAASKASSVGRRFTVAMGTGAEIQAAASNNPSARMTPDGSITFALGKESRYHMDLKNVRDLMSLRNSHLIKQKLTTSMTTSDGDALDKLRKEMEETDEEEKGNRDGKDSDNQDDDESDCDEYERQIDEMYSTTSSDGPGEKKTPGHHQVPSTLFRTRSSANTSKTAPVIRRCSMEPVGDMLRVSLANPKNKAVQRAIDAYLKSQLLNLVIVAKEQHTLQKQTLGDDNATAGSGATSSAAGLLSFRQFDLFSVKAETLCVPPTSRENKLEHDGGRCLDPFKVQVADIDLVDQYPLPSKDGNNDKNEEEEEYERMGPSALSSFCLPEGVTVRLIPRCAMDGARKMGWVGNSADEHQILAFTDGAGTTIHGVAIKIREALGESDTMDSQRLINNMRLHRKRRVASTLISRWWRKCRCSHSANGGQQSAYGSDSIRRVTSAPEIRKMDKLSYSEKSTRGLFTTAPSIRSVTSAMKSVRSFDTDSSPPSMDSPNFSKDLTKKKKKKSLNSLMKWKNQNKPSSKGETNASWDAISPESPPAKKSKKLTKKIKKQLLGKGSNSSPRKPTEFTDSYLTQGGSKVADEGMMYMPSMEVNMPAGVGASARSNILKKRRMLMRQNGATGTKNLNEKNISAIASHRAEEAYEEMIKNDRLGDVVVVEKCYVVVGGRPNEQILLLSALQQMINWEREERKLNQAKLATIVDPSNGLEKHSSLPEMGLSPDDLRTNSFDDSINDLTAQRHELLTIVQHLCRLTSEQARIEYPKRLRDYVTGAQRKFELTMPVRKAPKISLPLPLPQVDAHWGFATLLLYIGSDALMNVLKLLLIERSILVVGENSAEVTACSCALLELLQPYKWAGTFMPSLPLSMLDFVNSPVPFVAGAVAKYPCHIEKDHRSREAIGEGLSVVNLSTGKVCITTESNIKTMLSKCKDPTFTLNFHEQRLKKLAKDGSSALCSFSTFIHQGFSPQESVTIHSARVSIERHLRGMSGVIGRCRDGWRHYGKFNTKLNEFEFYPSKFVEPLRAQLQFQEMMAQTQLFVGYVDKRRMDDLTEDNIRKVKGVFIANWIYNRWVTEEKRGIDVF